MVYKPTFTYIWGAPSCSWLSHIEHCDFPKCQLIRGTYGFDRQNMGFNHVHCGFQRCKITRFRSWNLVIFHCDNRDDVTTKHSLVFATARLDLVWASQVQKRFESWACLGEPWKIRWSLVDRLWDRDLYLLLKKLLAIMAQWCFSCFILFYKQPNRWFLYIFVGSTIHPIVTLKHQHLCYMNWGPTLAKPWRSHDIHGQLGRAGGVRLRKKRMLKRCSTIYRINMSNMSIF